MSEKKKKGFSRKAQIITVTATLLIVAAALITRTTTKTDKAVGNIENNKFLLDTVVSIRLYNSEDEALLETAFDAIAGFEAELSRHKDGSEVSRINSDTVKALTVSPNTIEVLQTALKYAKLTSGAFDPTVGPLVDLWGIGSDSARIPDDDEILEVLGLVDFSRVSVDLTKNTVTLSDKNMEIDLGGIAKGWIADSVSTILRKGGAEHILINLGGNVLVSGGKPGNKPFKIGMQDPFDDRGSYLGIFSLSDGSVVSSGVYERYFESNGIRYHHILDTENGYPVDNGMAAVTIISEKSVDGDALSTAVFALGLEKGLELVEALSGIDAAFVTDSGQIIMTEGAGRIFEPTQSDLKVEIRTGG